MRSDGPSNDEVICACIDRLARRHKTLLVAGVRPAWTYARCDNLNFVAKLRPQKFRLKRTRYKTVDSRPHAKFRQSENVIVDVIRYSHFIQRSLVRARQNGYTQDQHVVWPRIDCGPNHFASAGQMNSQHLHT